MSGKYDIQWGSRHTWQSRDWSAGISAGYAKAIGRSKRIHLEMSLSAGYMRARRTHYVPTDSYDMLIRDDSKSGYLNWFGPTKAKVSLVVPIFVSRGREEVRYEW